MTEEDGQVVDLCRAHVDVITGANVEPTTDERAIALDPREPSYYYNCAISYLMQGNTAKALEQQEKLRALDPAIADRLASVIVKHQL